MKIFKKNQVYYKTFVQNIPRISQNSHPISSHPKGWVWLMLSHLHHLMQLKVNYSIPILRPSIHKHDEKVNKRTHQRFEKIEHVKFENNVKVYKM
jgi:hypothetical protein